MSSLPSSTLALTTQNHTLRLTRIPLPRLRPHHLLVRTHAVALNPTDWKNVARGIAAHDSIAGCDFAGTIAAIGDKVTRKYEIGEKVFGVVHGGNFNNKEDGAFSGYLMVKEGLVMRVPDQKGLGMEEVSTMGLGLTTVGQGLFQYGLKLKMDALTGDIRGDSPGEWVLIYGGSTATGSLAVQLAKVAGYRVVSVCGKKNERFVKDLGADAVVDYRDDSCVEQIKDVTEGGVRLAFDTVNEEGSSKICAEAIRPGPGGRYASFGVGSPRKDVEVVGTLMYTVFGEEFSKGGQKWEEKQEDYEFATKMFEIAERLVKEGKLRPHPAKIEEGGLGGVMNGLQKLRKGEVSGTKLVYRLEDTAEGDVGKELVLEKLGGLPGKGPAK